MKVCSFGSIMSESKVMGCGALHYNLIIVCMNVINGQNFLIQFRKMAVCSNE
jgi:hypothetical protein